MIFITRPPVTYFIDIGEFSPFPTYGFGIFDIAFGVVGYPHKPFLACR